ncbi:MAG: hypothetical protein PHS80_05320 [Methanothrix sp.]|nr:hypothetical protein [Methanothrix sp.]MDD4447714.1 hypothetical protein [Methanothrix sp.]
MKGNANVFICLVLILFIFISSQTCLAKNVGITISTTLSSSYPSTNPLRQETVDLLDLTENSDNEVIIGDALKQLQDGDVLVLSVHSNPESFAVGQRKPIPKWGQFWETFGINKPPALRAVIIGGCMANKVKETYNPASKEQLQAIRASLNADALFAPISAINPIVAGIDTTTLLKSILDGKKFGDIDLGGKWNYISSQEEDRDNLKWEAGCPDISGYKAGELRVTAISDQEGTSIPIGQKRNVGGNSFYVSQNDCEVTLKFNDNEISGTMVKGVAKLRNKVKGTVSKAILTHDTDNLQVLLDQITPNGVIITSIGTLR